MGRTWTFGQKIGFGFAVGVALTAVVGLIAVYALRSVVATMDRTISVFSRNLIMAEQLHAAAEEKAAAHRGYLLARDQPSLDVVKEARQEFLGVIERLRAQVVTAEGRRLIDDIQRKEADHQNALERVTVLRRTDAPIDTVVTAWERELLPRFRDLRQAITVFSAREGRLLDDEQRAAADGASFTMSLVILVAITAAASGTVIAMLLTGTLKRQIGSAVQHIQSASAELQSAATQQAAGSQEEASAMNEITVTVKELLTSARQIAESAQRVAKIADDTAAAAHSGDQTVQKAQDAISGIKSQMDLIVSHMLDLGKKSQQIGSVLEIINELAEQTNILAINATIEAAGAGEAGKRFAAVADEIRKLADRVGGSTKEIRALIDEVRAAVHTTIMATEGGAKTVDSGTRQFGKVAAVFKQIVTMVGTSTEAAREIELSTKQQSTAVEQVTIATTNVAQAAQESEASSRQTVQTAADLARLSHDLVLLVQLQARS